MDASDILRAYEFGAKARERGEPCDLCPEQAATLARCLGQDRWGEVVPADRHLLESAFVSGWTSKGDKR